MISEKAICELRTRKAGMITSMTVSKIAVSMPPELVVRVRAEVDAGRSDSVSSYVAEALAARLDQQDLSALLDDMLDDTGGAVTAAERKWADQILGIN